MRFSRKTLTLFVGLPFAALFAAHAGADNQAPASTPTRAPLSASGPTPSAASAVLAQARVRADLAQARRPVLGGVPTVVAARGAYGVQEQGHHSCRVALGYVHRGIVVRLDVTTYTTRDCVAIMDAAARATRQLP